MMLRKTMDHTGIAIGDLFLSFSSGGKAFYEGHVDYLDDDEVHVDFGDFRARYERQHVNKLEENCGYIREFYASRYPGEVIERFA